MTDFERQAHEAELASLEAIAEAARALRANNPGMSLAKSQAQAISDNPALYSAYVRANDGLRRAMGKR
jgi:hypothetical protein